MDEMNFPKVEDYTTEFKSRPGNLEREIVAFANTGGGEIYIGLNDNGEPSGLTLSNKIRSEIIDAVENCEPRPP
jgi:predicted HTH transcriptional regulator